MELKDFSINKIHKSLIKKEFSATELVKLYFDRIKKEEEVNDFLMLTENLALEQAKKIDEKILRREKPQGLEGIPIALKDNILVKGYKTTAGSKILKDYIAPYDATVTRKLKEAGAIILGKTNLDEFAMGSSTENSAFGPVKNPLDQSRVAGGSSGGSAAAVAAHHAVAALGSDTGGSIRQPAAFCGIIGFKPSYGMVSRYGLIAMASSLDQIGPMAKNVDDIKIIFNTIKGKDDFDATTLDFSQEKEDFIVTKELKIGVPKEYFGSGIDKDVKKEIEKAIAKFVNLGCAVQEISLPYTDYALAVYYIIAPAEISANLARYDGIKYGFSSSEESKSKPQDLLTHYLYTRAKGFGDEVRRRIMLGTYVLSAGYRDAYYNQAQKARKMIIDDFQKAFSSYKKVDFILTPTTPTPAFKIGERKDPLAMYLSDIYTVPASLAGLPAISMPCGTVNHLPIGIQIIGPQFRDQAVLEVAELFESIS